MRWGLLSTARINAKLVAGARAAGHEVVAVGSRSRARSVEHAAELALGQVRAHGSYAELLADDRVEAVYVALPNALHLEWATQALQAGKHVLCEKPLGRDPAAVEAAFDLAERHGRVLAEAFMWRQHPQARRFAELLGEGAIGAPRLARAAFAFPLGRPDDVRWSASLEGGALMDLGCYCVGGIRLAFGGAEPDAVSAELAAGGDGVDAALAAAMRFGPDRLATFTCSFTAARHQVLEVVGTEGSLRLPDPWHCARPVIEHHHGAGEVDRIHIEPADPYRCELDAFARLAAGHPVPGMSRVEAVAQARTLGRLHAASS